MFQDVQKNTALFEGSQDQSSKISDKALRSW